MTLDLLKLREEITPGPWRIVIDDDGNPLSGRPSVQASADLDCAVVHWDGFVQEYWRSARGDREIHAAAPDLLAETLRLRDQNLTLRARLKAVIDIAERGQTCPKTA